MQLKSVYTKYCYKVFKYHSNNPSDVNKTTKYKAKVFSSKATAKAKAVGCKAKDKNFGIANWSGNL